VWGRKEERAREKGEANEEVRRKVSIPPTFSSLKCASNLSLAGGRY
jgi:hypothetical protein